ncbi:hypothetical protein [Paenibacillus polymyxa]|uniref:hypothetical protein n=1 Tax=Paenibacillus TaxID=44249 RepID=UPI001F576B75|nr:hypothetical protein [Paenibacillus polymyxa]UNL93644.1 hypothetical protein CPY53_08760 [Paenibacillus polymyxa]
MYYIKDAKIRRFTELDGVRCAEVEVRPGAADDPELLVYITASNQKDGQPDYDMVRIIRNDADLELDWYDNNLHSAFEEVTDKAFTDSTHITAGEEREKFKRELLSYGQLSTEFAKEFGA